MPSQQLQTLRNIQKQQLPQYGSTINLNSKLIDTHLHDIMFGSLQCVQQPQQQQYEAFSYNNSHSSLAHCAMYPSTKSNLNSGIVSGLLPATSISNEGMYASEQQLCQPYSSQQHSDYIISDYMEKIGTRINVLETELKFAWGALDLLSTEYSKIWSRLEKLENLMVEQQSVVKNLMGLINIKRREEQQLELDNKSELLLNDIFLPNEQKSQCTTNSLINQDKELCLNGKFDHLYEDLNKQETTSKMIKSEIDTLDELLKEQQRQQHCTEEDLQFVLKEKAKSSGFTYNLGIGQLGNRRCGSRNSISSSVSPALQMHSKSNCQPAQENILSNFDEVYTVEQKQQEDRSFLDQLTANKRVNHTSRLPASYNILSSENDGLFNSIFPEAISTELNSLSSCNEFFRVTASKTGPDVIHIEQEDDTEEGRTLKSEMNEDFYKSLNEMYRENNLATEFNYKFDDLLYQSEQQNDQITIGLTKNSSLTNSTLDMIHEDNEDEINNEKHKSIDDSSLKTFGITKSSATTLSPSTASPAAVLKHSKVSKKHKKKKHHHKDEMEMINNLKSALAEKNMNFEFSSLTSKSSNQVNQTDLVRNGSETYRSRTTSSSSEENFGIFYENSDRLDTITKTLLLEINKIGDFSSPSKEEIKELRKLVISEKIFLEKLNQVNKNLILLLLNPLTMAEELKTVENMGWFEMVMRKLEKNINTLKKLVGNSFDNYKTQVEAATSFCQLNSSQEDTKGTSGTTLVSVEEKSQEITHSAPQSEISDYSFQLIRHNSNLDEQLKLLESQEQEMNKKKQIHQKKQEQQISDNIVGLNNFLDLDASFETFFMQEINDPNLTINGDSVLKDSSLTPLSPNNIYSNDAYIKSLKRSLERHNSMLYLLHLQNPDYKSKLSGLGEVEDDILLNESANRSPPPPAPDIDFTRFNSSNPRTNDVMLVFGNNDTNNSVNPFVILDLSKTGSVYSPKQTRSNSELSSMSGLSNWDKSAYSPSLQTLNGSENNPFISQYQDINMKMFQLLSMTPQKLPAEYNNLGIEQTKKQKEYVFSEENLNYIRELSKNLPICSAFENKSMFSIFEHNIHDEHENSLRIGNDMLSFDQQQQLEKRRMPDLVKTEINARSFMHLERGDYHDSNKIPHRNSAQLIDRLVFYPTSRNLIDYKNTQISDHNLHHLKEKDAKFQEKHKSACKPLTVYDTSYDSSPTERYELQRREHSKQRPKVWQRLGSLLNDNFKLKYPKRHNRSQSLPTDDMKIQRSMTSMRDQAESYPSVFTSVKKNIAVNRTTDSLQKSLEPLSTTNVTGDKHHKRAAFTTSMNNFIQKAKTYRRYNFGLRHGFSLSDPEADLASFTSSDNDEAMASDCEVIMPNGFDKKTKKNFNTMQIKNFEVQSEMHKLEDLEFLNQYQKQDNLRTSDENLNRKSPEKSERNTIESFSEQKSDERSENEAELSEQIHIASIKSLFPIVGNKAPKVTCLDEPKLDSEHSGKKKLFQQEEEKLSEPADGVSVILDNENTKNQTGNQRHLQKVNSVCIHEERQGLCTTTLPNMILTTTEERETTADAPSTKSAPVVGRPTLPSTQQSLEIPSLTASSKEDEDNRSQYSYRTLSSSRRQSTEDSIDTDDEYFCYELRQLDEMEKQQKEQVQSQQKAIRNQHLFNQIDQLTAHDITDDLVDYEPDGKVRAKMSEVLQELKYKVMLQPEVLQHHPTSKPRIVNEKYTKVTDIHKAWQDINGDFIYNTPISEVEFKIEYNKNVEPSNDEIESLDHDERLQQKLLTQETEKPPPQKRYKKRRNMRRLNITIDDIENSEALTYSSSSSLSSDGEGKRQHSKNVKSAQLRRNSHERQKKLPVINSSDSSFIDKNKNKLNNAMKPIDLIDVEVENKENGYSLSSGATSGPDSPAELSGFENDTKQQNSEDNSEIFKTVPNYTGLNNNQTCGSLNDQHNTNDDSPPISKPHIEENHSQRLYNQYEDNRDKDNKTQEHDSFQAATINDNISLRSYAENKPNLSLDEQYSETHLQQTNIIKTLPKLISEESSIDISQTNGSALSSSKWKLLKTLKERKLEERNNQEKIKEDELNKQREKNGSSSGDVGLRSNGHPGDNPFYSNIDSMPDIRPRRKSIPLVSELVSVLYIILKQIIDVYAILT